MSLVPIKALTPDHVQELAQKSEMCTLTKGKKLFQQGEESKRIIYLLEGEVELVAATGDRKSVTGGSKVSKLPLEQGNTHRFTAIAKSDAVRFIKVDPNLLDIMLTWEQSGGYEVQEVDEGGDDDWMARLLQAQVFHRIPPANIQSIFMKLEAKQYRVGEPVIKQGDDGEHFYIIREGVCDVIRKTRKNPEGVRLARLSVGDNFGEEALISGGKRNASVVMASKGVLMSLSKSDFLGLMNEPLLNWCGYSEAKEVITSGGIWLDVRLPQEFQARRFAKSVINLPLPLLRAKLDKLDSSKKYVTVCDTGRRSSTAAYLLTQNGFQAYVLKDGLQSVDPSDLVSWVELLLTFHGWSFSRVMV